MNKELFFDRFRGILEKKKEEYELDNLHDGMIMLKGTGLIKIFGESYMDINKKWMKLLEQQFSALTALRSADLIMPHLMLFYTTIDIFAYIWGKGEDSKIGERFRGFCDEYLITHLPEFNSYDLWGARCAILHTASPESDLSKKGKSRQILYSWGIGKVELLKKVIAKSPDSEKYLAISLESLEDALGEALIALVEDLSKSPDWGVKSMERLNKVYATIPVPKNIGINKENGSD